MWLQRTGQRIHASVGFICFGTMTFRINYHRNPSNSCWNISVWSKKHWTDQTSNYYCLPKSHITRMTKKGYHCEAIIPLEQQYNKRITFIISVFRRALKCVFVGPKALQSHDYSKGKLFPLKASRDFNNLVGRTQCWQSQAAESFSLPGKR